MTASTSGPFEESVETRGHQLSPSSHFRGIAAGFNMLEAGAVTKYLLEKGLIHAADVVRSGIQIRALERKNVSFHVATAGASFILKRSRFAGDTSVLAEAAAYDRLVALGDNEISEYLPRFIQYDPAFSVLILEYILSSANLREYHASTRRAPKRIGRELGTALALLHASSVLRRDALKVNGPIPWVIQLMAPPIDTLFTESVATIELIRRIQGNGALRDLLTTVRKSWSVDAMCHNDVRLDNILYDAQRERQTPGPRLALVDWELAELSWSFWDLACFFAGYVELWIAAVSESTSEDLAAGVDLPPYKRLTHFHPLLQTFWNEYCTRRQLVIGVAERTIIVRLAAARLLQSALEYSQQSLQPAKQSIMFINIASKLALRPLESWVHVFGLPLTPSTGKVWIDDAAAVPASA